MTMAGVVLLGCNTKEINSKHAISGSAWRQ
jgi:hypothetical protein